MIDEIDKKFSQNLNNHSDNNNSSSIKYLKFISFFINYRLNQWITYNNNKNNIKN